MNQSSYGRKDRLIKEKLHNVYRDGDKSLGLTRCTGCNALYKEGRWTWEAAPPQAADTICPACRRIADRYPAGFVELKGPFFLEHRDEIMSLAANVEKKEKEERPLERIMGIENEVDFAMVTTTGIHVARRIGEAVAKAYKGDLTFQYAEGEKRVRVYWQR
jgi:NMD protein affecting ribosome stability and mRNA decay